MKAKNLSVIYLLLEAIFSYHYLSVSPSERKMAMPAYGLQIP